MQRVRIQVMRLRRYAADTAFEVYADLGSGTIDYGHPLPPGRVPLWPESTPRRGHLLDAHLATRHMDGVALDGHLQTVHLLAEHLYPAWPVEHESPGYSFGRFRHAVRMFDGPGNTDAVSEATVETTVNSAPTEPRNCHFVAYDHDADRVTLAFDPARFEPRPGN